MATADLGIRIVLTDTASSGFAAVGLSMGNLVGQIALLSLAWNNLSSLQQGAAATALGAEATFTGFSSALGDVIGAAGDLQASMIQIEINVRGADSRMQDMQNTLTNLADYSVFSSQQVADGFVRMGQQGYTAANIIDNNMGKAMVDLAESIGSDTVPAAQLLSTTMRIWGADASQATMYANALSFAYHNGIPDVEGLQQAIAQSGSQAVLSGMNIKDFVLILDDLARAGIPASQAGTSLRYMLQALEDPTAKALKEMADLGVVTINQAAPGLYALLGATQAYDKSPLRLDGTLTALNQLYTEAVKVGTIHTDKDFYQWALQAGYLSNNLYDANGHFRNLAGILMVLGPALANLKTPEDFQAAIEQLFNVRGGKGAQVLLENLGLTKQQVSALSQLYDQYQKQNGVQSDATKVTSGWNAIMKELGSTVHSTAAQIGMPLLGALSAVGEGLNQFLNHLRTSHSGLLEVVGPFLVFGTVLSGIALVIAGVVAAISIAGPVLAIVGLAIGAIVAGSAYLAVVFAVVKDHWSQITAVANDFLNVVRPIGNFLGGLFGGILKDLGQQLHTFGGVELGGVANIVNSLLVPSLHSLGEDFTQLINFIKPVMPLFQTVGGAVLAVVGVIVGALTSGILYGAVHFLLALFASILTVLSGVVTAVSGILQVFIGLFMMVFGVIHGIVNGNMNMIVDSITHNFKALAQGVGSIFAGIMQVIVGAMTALVGAPLAAVGGFVSGVIHFFTNLGNAVNGVVNAVKNAIGSLISSFQNMRNIPGLGGIISGGQAIFSHIPGLATGGVVTAPTLAVVGEGREPEVVLPVSKLAAFMSNYAGAGVAGGGNIVVPLMVDGQQIAGVVINRQTGQIRQMGAGRMFR
jgi:hypothetical protein